ncbi:MAG: M23 family metallopeptidase [Oscillospiraceae bacterium]|nr:M23 family metallopeptidase [Oscillospiraceae bacterium]
MKKLTAFLLVFTFAFTLAAESYASPALGNNAGIRFIIEGNATNPGEAVVIRAVNIPQNAKIQAETDIPFQPMFFREALREGQTVGDMVAILPVSYSLKPGDYYITLTCEDVARSFRIRAGEKEFSVQHLSLPRETADQTILSQNANAEYERYIAPVRRISDSTQYWQGKFLWPLRNHRRITTTFGAIRYVNSGSTPSRHGALDIAAPAGTPVYASGAGRVVYAGYLQLTGNTIVIEHGYGLKTWYYHMNGLNVKTDEMARRGQQIGTVGSTGFSTGPHLHFGMSVSNLNGHVFINPDTAIDTDLFNVMARPST